MAKRIILSIILIFILWTALDMLTHSVLLGSTYESTAELWRPPEQMNKGLLFASTLLSAFVLTAIFAGLVRDKRPGTGLSLGFLLGLAGGFSMGFCTYATMPITLEIATLWALGEIVKFSLAGLLLGRILKNKTGETS